MRLFLTSRAKDAEQTSPQTGEGEYARLITDNLSFIERQCRRAVQQTMSPAVAGSLPEDGVDLENHADELLNEVLDRLREDDFRVLRNFLGKAKLTTYITTIIANLVVDLVRQKKGRSRARERAREMGEVGERLYDLVYTRGCTLDQAHTHLEITHGIREKIEHLQEMLERMRGRGERSQLLLASDPEEAWLVPGKRVVVEDEAEVVVADPRRDAESALLEREREHAAGKALSGLLSGLSGEDSFLLRLRFPADDSEPRSFKEIARLLGATEKSVDAKLRRILLGFRETLLRQGLRLEDLL